MATTFPWTWYSYVKMFTLRFGLMFFALLEPRIITRNKFSFFFRTNQYTEEFTYNITVWQLLEAFILAICGVLGEKHLELRKPEIKPNSDKRRFQELFYALGMQKYMYLLSALWVTIYVPTVFASGFHVASLLLHYRHTEAITFQFFLFIVMGYVVHLLFIIRDIQKTLIAYQRFKSVELKAVDVAERKKILDLRV